MNVLIVEDDQIAALDLSHTVRGLGHTVSGICRRGQEALKYGEAKAADVVLMDIVLPGDIDGIEAARLLGTKGTRVIYVTGNSDPKTVERSVATNPLGFLVKPVDSSRMEAALLIACEYVESENRLLAEREQLLEAQRIAGVGSWSYNVSTHQIDWSDETYRLLNWSEDAAPPSYEQYRQFFTASGWSEFKTAIAQAISSAVPVDLTLEVQPVGKPFAKHQIRCAPIPDSGGRVRKLHGTWQIAGENSASSGVASLIDKALRSSAADITICGPEQRVVAQSRGSVAQWGDLLGKTFNDASLPKSVREMLLRAHREARARRVSIADLPLENDELETRTIRSLAAPCELIGSTDGTVGLSIDVTDLANEQRRLRAASFEAMEVMRRLRGFFDAMSDAVFVVDAQTLRVLDANAAALRLIDSSIVEMSGRELFSFLDLGISPETGEDRVAAIRRVRRARGKLRVLRDGVIPVDIHIDEPSGFSSNPVLQVVVQDLSSAKITPPSQVSIEQENRMLAQIASHTTNAVIVADSELKLKWVNLGFTRMTGYALGDVFGKSLLEFLQGQKATTAEIEDLQKRLLRFEGFRSCVESVAKDGRLFWQEFEVQAIRDESGQLSCYMALGLDVTERIENAQALSESNARTAAVLAALPDQIFVFHRDGRYTAANNIIHPFLPGRDSRAIDSLLDAEEQGQVAEIAQSVSKTEEMTTYALNRRKADGGFQNLEVRMIPYGAGHVLVVFRDVTEQQRMKQERERLQANAYEAQRLETIGMLAGGIAHDFNNLLTGILGNAGLAKLDVNANPTVRVALDEIERASLQAAELCSQMLAYAGQARSLYRPINLSGIVESMREWLAQSLGSGVELECELTQPLPMILADEVQIRQLIGNIYTNAREAIGGAAGKIVIEVGQAEFSRTQLSAARLGAGLTPGTYVFLRIEDSGVGMTTEVLSRIFDPFFSTKFTGRGLGMAAVHGIMRTHKGAIFVRSAPGAGTQVRLLFPIDTNSPGVLAPAVSAQPTPVPPAHAMRRLPKVLVIEREEVVRNVARRLLEKLGCEVFAVVDITEAKKILIEDREPIECVILDFVLYDAVERESVRTLREFCKDVPLFFCSGRSEQEIQRKLGNVRYEGYINKPYRLAALRIALVFLFSEQL